WSTRSFRRTRHDTAGAAGPGLLAAEGAGVAEVSARQGVPVEHPHHEVLAPGGVAGNDAMPGGRLVAETVVVARRAEQHDAAELRALRGVVDLLHQDRADAAVLVFRRHGQRAEAQHRLPA